MCGIASWAGKDVKDFNLYKLGVLGIFNEKRGVHSCGITTDFKIAVGVDDTKVFRDFMRTEDFKSPEKHPFVIAHTRKATGGAHNKYNSHPFGYGINEKTNSHRFVGVHNGSLLNDDDLAKEFEIDVITKNEKNVDRTKIDSEILLECIYKSNSFRVLEKYDGAAALVFANDNEPDTIYCYRGESLSGSIIEEERPLFYWQENENSLYISSIEESLEAITNCKEDLNNIKAFEPNYVYKIKNGNVSDAQRFKINRSNRIKTYKSYTSNTNSNYKRTPTCSLPPKKKNKPNNNSKVRSINPSIKHNIYNDAPLEDESKNPIKSFRLRYKRNGHNINGCYIYIKNYGFYFLDEEPIKAQKEIVKLIGKEFNNKNFPLVPLRHTIKERNYIPVKKDILEDSDINNFIYYFIDGVRLKTHLDYAIINNNLKKYTTLQLSIAASHPIMEDIRSKPFNKQQIYYNGDLANGTFSFLGSNKIYTINKGNCINIRPTENYKKEIESNNETKNSIDNSKEVKESNDIYKVVSDDILKKESEKASAVIKENEKVQDLIFDRLMNSYYNIDSLKKDLVKYDVTNPLANKVLDVLEDFIINIENVMENELKIELNDEK